MRVKPNDPIHPSLNRYCNIRSFKELVSRVRGKVQVVVIITHNRTGAWKAQKRLR